MYAVQGGPALNGEQYYNFMIKGSSYVIAFGNKIPEIECAPGHTKKETCLTTS